MRWALLAAVPAGLALLLWQMRGQTLAYDEWSFFAEYRGWGPGVVANPFGDNLMALPILLYKAIFELGGPDSPALKVLAATLNVTVAGLFYALARPRVGSLLAAPAAGLLVVFGVSTDIVAQTLGIAIMLTVALGLGTLLALERGDDRGDRTAAVLLALALASNSHALPFAAAAAVQVGWADERPARRRLWIVAAPLAAYAAWRLWSLHLEPLGTLASHPSDLGLAELGSMASSVADSLGAAMVSITGLFASPSVGGSFREVLAPTLGALALIGLALRLRFGPRPRRLAAVFAAGLLTYWVLIGLVGNDRLPELPRYQYLGSILLMLLAAELARGISIGSRARLASAGVLAAALLSNLSTLVERSEFFRERSELNRAALAAVEIARDRADPRLLVEPLGARVDLDSAGFFSGAEVDIESDILISVGSYLSAADELGSPAFDRPELRNAPAAARDYADRELASLMGIEATQARIPARGRCERARGTSGAPAAAEAEVAPGGKIMIAADRLQPARAGLARFGDSFSVDLGVVPAGGRIEAWIPTDRSERPWRARVVTAGRANVCAVGP